MPEKHNVDPFVPLLKRDATCCALGALAQIPVYNIMQFVMQSKSLAGSLIGSIAETQEVLDFCAGHGIAPDMQVIPIQDVNQLQAG